jgi:hypothetical protein
MLALRMTNAAAKSRELAHRTALVGTARMGTQFICSPRTRSFGNSRAGGFRRLGLLLAKRVWSSVRTETAVGQHATPCFCAGLVPTVQVWSVYCRVERRAQAALFSYNPGFFSGYRLWPVLNAKRDAGCTWPHPRHGNAGSKWYSNARGELASFDVRQLCCAEGLWSPRRMTPQRTAMKACAASWDNTRRENAVSMSR